MGSVRAMYVGPLKALINDQFRRVEDLCGYLDMPVHRWHGDVSATHKAALVKSPGGVLLITPESLESLFVNRSAYLVSLFGGLQFVVIDEVHTFLDNERGLHLKSLLSRVRRITREASKPGRSFRVVGLSATIGDLCVAQRFVDADHPERVHIITDDGTQKEVKFRIHGYRLRPVDVARERAELPQTHEPGSELSGEVPEESAGDPVRDGRLDVAKDIVGHCAGAANLVFANSRADVEEFADLAKEVCAEQGLDMEILVHHGSLAADIRQGAEATMKSGCSATLELGIDIGSVKMVGQVGAPWSVSSMKQRLGRSGRHEGEPSIMRVYMECQEPGSEDGLFDRLHLGLVQSAALTELMLEKWVEPPRPPTYDLSTLTQQIMSVICERGGVPAATIFERLCKEGSFREIEPLMFQVLLRALGARDVINQMPEGDLILGLRGERLRRDKGFYAVFKTPEDFAVYNGEELLGTLEILPRVDDHLLFAGRRWKVVEVDIDKRQVRVVPARGVRRPKFTSAGGEIHPHVREKMKQVLSDTKHYAYLDEEAAALLEDARAEARRAGVCERQFIDLGSRKTAFMTWTGTRIQETTQAILNHNGIGSYDHGIALELKSGLAETRKALAATTQGRLNAVEIAAFLLERERRRYDWLLGGELLDIANSLGYLDMNGAKAILASAVDGETPTT